MIGQPQPFEHERYEELCTLATAGVLTAAESEDLFAHLSHCVDCSNHFAEYQSLASEGMSRLADLYRISPEAHRFAEDNALERLLQSTKASGTKKPAFVFSVHRYLPGSVWRGLAAASVLAGVAFCAYEFGASRHPKLVVEHPLSAPLQTLSAGPDVQILRGELQDAEQKAERLQVLAVQRGLDLDRAREDARQAQIRLENLSASESSVEADEASKLKIIAEERDASIARVQQAELLAKNAQDDLSAVRNQRKQDLARLASLENQVGSLTVALNEQNNRAKDDEQYLTSDKDIRDLIGARNLYIADIMDVSEDGSSRKPFGRVFYTKTKSLIFYAYDLDKQPGVKTASTFEVWGRTGPDDRKPLNLGVLYLDSETNRRWTLRVDNPEQLARLDSVFVTIEQRERADKPTGKPFLYASLRREPNHP